MIERRYAPDRAWDTCGRWPDQPHASDCAWYIAANTPEAKAKFIADVNTPKPCTEHPECGVCQGNRQLCSAHLHAADLNLAAIRKRHWKHNHEQRRWGQSAVRIEDCYECGPLVRLIAEAGLPDPMTGKQ